MRGYVKCFDNGGTNMYFMTKDNKLFKKYNTIWNNVSNLMKIEFDSETVYGD